MKPEQYRLSIITPTYNRVEFLPRVKESLDNQSFKDFEWIIVDDGSTDDTKKYLDRIASERVVVLYQENQGQNVARSKGEEVVRGRYVIFLDSDDELYGNDVLAMMFSAIDGTTEDIGVVGFSVVTPHGGGGHSRLAEDEMILDYGDIICGCKIKGEIFRIFKRQALRVTSWWPYSRGMLNIRYNAIAKEYKYMIINKPALIYHMNHGGNITSAHQTIKRAASMVIGYEKLIQDNRNGYLEICPEVIGLNYFHAAMYCCIDGQDAKSFKMAIQSLIESGPLLKNIILLGSLLIPLTLRQKLFVIRSRWRGRI
jgi:glycosyltransferase involved in cell wall biosynthesis